MSKLTKRKDLVFLKSLYKASDCTSFDDLALNSFRAKEEIHRRFDKGLPTKALYDKLKSYRKRFRQTKKCRKPEDIQYIKENYTNAYQRSAIRYLLTGNSY